jgi:uncharacterized protein with beta-barrel porin domain
MTKSTLNYPVLATGDSKKDFKKNISSYISIAAIGAASTFGSIANVEAGIVEMGDGTTSQLAQMNETNDIVTSAANANTHIITLNTGDISVASLSNATAGNNVITITDTNTIGSFTIGGDVVISQGNLAFTLSQDATTLTFGGNITESNSKTGIINLNTNDVTVFSGTGANVDAKVDGVADADGTINVTGTVQFDDAIGGTKEIGTMNISGASTFILTTDIEAVVATANTTFTAAFKADTLSVTDSVVTIIAAATDTDQDSEALVTTLNDTSSTGQITFASGSAVDYTGTIVAAAANEGKILVAGNAGGVDHETTFKGVIGVTGTRIGNIEVGTTALSGKADMEAAVFTKAMSIIGGNASAEDSTVDMGASITSTDGFTMNVAGAGDAKIAITASSTLNGVLNKTGAGDGNTIIAVGGVTGTFVSTVGSTTAIDSLTLEGTSTAAINADFDATSTVITDGGTITFDAGASQSFSGTLTVAADDDGIINNNNTDGTLTFNGSLGADEERITEITLADNSITTFKDKVFAKTLDINTAANEDLITVSVDGNAVGDFGANAGALQIVAGAKIKLGDTIVAGETVFATDAAAADADGVVIAGDILIAPAANFVTGQITLIDGNAANISSTELADILVEDTILTDFVVSGNTHDVVLTANAKDTTTVAKSLKSTKNDALAIQQLIRAATAGGEATLITTLDSDLTLGGTGATTSKLAIQASPQTDAMTGSATATRAMTGTVQGIVSNRMASLRSGDAYVAGMSAGNGMSANSGFIQAFGSEAEQKTVTKSGAQNFGFDTETQGLAIGFDGITDSGSTIGLSASYSTTDVDGKGTGKSTNSIDSYTISAYADKATDNGYIEGSVTYGINENTTGRLVNVAGLNRTYKGVYDSEQLSVMVGAGAPNEVANSTYVTPFASVTSTLITSDAYTETSTTANDPLKLKVAQDDVSSMVGSVGVKAHMVTDMGTPMISLAVNNEFGDNTITSSNTYTGGGTAFKTSNAVEEMSATLGLGYSFGSDSASVNLVYEAEADDNKYIGHYGSVKIVAKF